MCDGDGDGGVRITEKVLLEDVYFGDVWLCGGQSNMEFTVNTAFNGTQEIALADRYPHIRLLTVGQGTTSTEVRSLSSHRDTLKVVADANARA
jgi:sialate O-acetylesterase